MNTPSLRQFFAALVRLSGIWYVADDTPPSRVVEIALKKWKNSATALRKLFEISELSSNVLCAMCLLWSSLEPDDALSTPQTLQKLLERLPVQAQSTALSLTTKGDDIRTARLLTQFSAPVPQGLRPLAQSLTERWKTTGRRDDIALRFYQALLRMECRR